MTDNPVDRLINYPGAFIIDKKADSLFLEAMQSSVKHHYNNNNKFRNYFIVNNFTPEKLKTFSDLEKMPFISVNVFKREKLISVNEKNIKLTLTSSGTTGLKSAIYLDKLSLERIEKIVFNVFSSFGMTDRKNPCNYLMFTYDTKYASDVGTAWSDELLSGLTAIKSMEFVLKFDSEKKDFYPDFEGSFNYLLNISKENLPLRILGFPAYLYEFYIKFKNKKKFSFPKNSFVITGGGWKTLKDREIPKNEFRKEISRWLGIPSENIRDLLGMVEHGVPYVECENGNFHIPAYSRVFARDPISLRYCLKEIPDYSSS